MLFVDPLFLFVFLPVALGIWRLLGYLRVGERGLLLAAIGLSLWFYSWISLAYTCIPLFSVCLNWWAGALMVRFSAQARSIATAAVVINLCLLGLFKYAEFLGGLMLNLAMPLGISFFTFQQISYVVDVYKTRVHESSFLRYAFVVSFFPHLIAGPLVRYSEFRTQFAAFSRGRVLPRNLSVGVFLIVVGLVKKIIFADTLAPFADTFFSRSPEEIGNGSAAATLLASFAFYLQIYFDFSGYTDIAIGVARLFNIKFPKNFDYPYAAASVSEFWQRWHITLSRFLRDYLYIPLGGSRVAAPLIAVNLMVTMLLGGLWHGAAWNFILWGGLHGLALIVVRLSKNLRFRLPFLFAWLCTQTFVGLAWVAFRAPSLEAALQTFRSLGTIGGDSKLATEMMNACFQRSFFKPLVDAMGFGSPGLWVGLFFAAAWMLATFRIGPRTVVRMRAKRQIWMTVVTLISGLAAWALWVRVVGANRPDPFLYFQF